MHGVSALESSAISKSRSSEQVTVSNRKKLMLGKTKTVDIIFPLIDQMCQNTKIPSFAYGLVSYFFYLQIIFTANWPNSYYWSITTPAEARAINILMQIFWFCPKEVNAEILQFTTIAFASVFVLSVIYLGVILYYYQLNHRFIAWTLYPSRIIIELMAPILFHPAAALVGNSFLLLYQQGNQLGWIYLVVGFIVMVGFTVMFSAGYMLSCKSACITLTPYSMFDPNALIILVVASASLLILAYFLSILLSWITIIMQTAHLFVLLYVVYLCTYFPFHTFTATVTGMTVGVVAIACDIFYYYLFTDMNFSSTWTIVMVCSVAVVSFLVIFIVMRRQQKKIIGCMNGKSLNDEDKAALFSSLGLVRNEMKSIMFLRIAFTEICDRFVDFSILKFVFTNFDSNKAITSCVQILSYFPGESRQLNAVFVQISNQRNLGFSDRFLIYQVFRIKTLRQSSTSIEANDRLADLKSQGDQLDGVIRSFWQQKKPNSTFFEMIAAENKKLNALWQEVIRDYPNSAKFSEEYSHFLIESTTDFYQAIVQKQRANLIETGVNFAIDLSFKSLCHAYPNYIKKGVLDLKGNFKSNLKQIHHSGSSASSTTPTKNSDTRDSTMGTSAIEIDQELEDAIGKSIIVQSKLRVALHHALTSYSSFSSRAIPYSMALTILVSFGIFIGVYVYTYIVFEVRGTSMQRIGYLAGTRFTIDLTALGCFMDWATRQGLMLPSSRMPQIYEEDANPQTGVTEYYFGQIPGIDYTKRTMQYEVQATDLINQLFNNLAQYSAEGGDVYSFAKAMMSDLMDGNICANLGRHITLKVSHQVIPKTEIVKTYPTNYKYTAVYTFYLVGQIVDSWTPIASAGDDDISRIMSHPSFCELYEAINSSSTVLPVLITAFSKLQVKNGVALSNTLLILIICIPIAAVVLIIFPVTFLIFYFNYETNQIATALLEFDTSIKNDAKRPIRRDTAEEEMEVHEVKINRSRITCLALVIFFLGVALTALAIGMVLYANKTNEDISLLNQWVVYATRQISTSAESLLDILLVLMIDYEGAETFTTLPSIKAKFQASLKSVLENHRNLLTNGDGVISCTGFDSLLDEYNIRPSCTSNQGISEIHNIYKCVSTDRCLTLFTALMETINDNPGEYKGNLNHLQIVNLIHMADVHLWSRMVKTQDRIIELAGIRYETLKSVMMWFMIAGIACALISLIPNIFVRNEMIGTFGACLSMIKRVPPLKILGNKKLMNLLLHKGSELKHQGMTLEHSIIQNSQDGILATDGNGVVEICNPANTAILGYRPEQLLGQPISIFFIPDESENIEKQMDLMRTKQSALVFEGHTVCFSDHETNIPCAVTILGMTNKNQNVESFVFILRDESGTIKEKEEAEEAKARSENLLYQILPRGIVLKLNQGEKDISFSVPSASITFIDIVRFSDYSATLTPEQIMGNLSSVFASMDASAAKYPLVMKIKLIGDVYMAAAGLFNTEEPPTAHAEQIVKFGLDVLLDLEDINMRLNASLAVRIGVNSGGPLIAGVLGTDKPVFDIIGDPINVAARLQSTDVPGRIQIPESTYELIKEMNFDIMERGKVFLKGKGETMAYFVRPTPGFVSHFSSQDFLAESNALGSTPSVPSAGLVGLVGSTSQ